MFAKLKLLLMLLSILHPQPELYSVWAEPGIHIVMCDNGTPADYEDDYVIDWEDNRVVSVYVFD